MSIVEIIFYVFGGLTILSALGVLLSSKVLYSAVSLLASLLGVAGLYVLSHADFLAVTQILIYVGGIIVLMIFGVMVTKRVSADNEVISFAHNKGIGFLLGIVTFAILFIGIAQTSLENIDWIQQGKNKMHMTTSIPILGEKLMTTYLFPFEIAAIFLLIVLIGAVFIAGKNVTSK
jgi:NADH-quinone oxidoreductase subunit J